MVDNLLLIALLVVIRKVVDKQMESHRMEKQCVFLTHGTLPSKALSSMLLLLPGKYMKRRKSLSLLITSTYSTFLLGGSTLFLFSKALLPHPHMALLSQRKPTGQ